MLLVVLRFSDNAAQAAQHADGHRAWIARGFDDGVFVLAGSLRPAAGGVIVAHATSRAALEARVQDDPFVAQNVVSAEILEVAPGRQDPRLAFLAA